MRLSGMETGQMFLEIEVITARTEIRSKLRGRREKFYLRRIGSICLHQRPGSAPAMVLH
jgi:hypothetical protein